jgi:hypothetical protein
MIPHSRNQYRDGDSGLAAAEREIAAGRGLCGAKLETRWRLTEILVAHTIL